MLPEQKPVRRRREMIDLLALEEPKPKPAKIRAVSYEAAIDRVVQTHTVVSFGPFVYLGCRNSHCAGTSAGAPLSLIKSTRNFAGWVPLAFRSTT